MTERQSPHRLRIELVPTPTAASDVRIALRRAISGTCFEPRQHDAYLVASELVTNAVLHGREPIRVIITVTAEWLRLEVTDASPVSPTFSLMDPTAVTGRGLLLVSSLADRWGVDPSPDGKTVWMELVSRQPAPAVEADIDALLAEWGEGLAMDPADECVRVVLTDLDAELLAATEAHVEGVLRELALMVSSDQTSPRIAQIAAQVLDAAERFDATRNHLKRQVALATRTRQSLMDIELSIRRGDAELVRDYRQALETADRLCAEGELLHERPDPLQVALRNGYLNRILAQLGS